MRIPKFMIASTVCLAVVGGTALVYAQDSDTRTDNPPAQSQTSPPSDQAPSSLGSGGMSTPSQEQAPSSTGTTPDNGSYGSTMDNSSSNAATPSNATPMHERPARADRN